MSKNTREITFPQLYAQSEAILDLAWHGEAPPSRVRNVISAQRNQLSVIALRGAFGTDHAMTITEGDVLTSAEVVKLSPPISNGKRRVAA